MSPPRSVSTPTILVIFGATGDLTAKKIVPALFHLFNKKLLSTHFHIIGFARRELSREAFRDRAREIIQRHGEAEDQHNLTDFLKLFSYQRGFLEERRDYRNLAKVLDRIDKEWGVCSNKLFYLAVPPELYRILFRNLAASGLTRACSPEEGWTRVLVEKPFGKDLETAEALENLLAKLFREIQIYRIDHYLAKEMVQNILAFRFSNNLLEKSWNNDFIERIDIRLLETIGAEGRGAFYDGLGALRDVGQNHLLQMLAFVTMDHPRMLAADAIRQKRAETLSFLRPPSKSEIKTGTFRAQYDGYRTIPDVRPNSTTETYFKVRAWLDAPRWRDVPIWLEAGKSLAFPPRKNVVISFRHSTPCLCGPAAKEHYKNRVIFSLEPEEKITIQFWSKKPGLEFAIEKRSFDFLLRGKMEGAQYVEEYEKLLLDAIAGDQTLFVSTDEVKSMWRYIDPIVRGWDQNAVPLASYSRDTDVILKAAAKIETRGVGEPVMKKEIGVMGLGKMGRNLALQLLEKGWRVAGWNRTAVIMKELEKEGLIGSLVPKDLLEKLSRPRLIWLMLPAGTIIDEILFGQERLSKLLNKGDIIIDGGNSFYKDSIRRAKKLEKLGLGFVDVGVSGGPSGARYGASLMIGGKKAIFQKLESLFRDISREGGYQFFPGAGAGHFIKMVHNGIEYGMMQAIAEGFTILRRSNYKLDLGRVADVYNHGSVIESRLVGWLKEALELYGEDLKKVSGSVKHTGEGAWTVKTAREMKLKAKIIEEALKFRVESERRPSYTGKILSALRGQFGGHTIT